MDSSRLVENAADCGIQCIQWLIAPWSANYLHRTEYRGTDSRTGDHLFDVTFCKLTPEQPVADVEATVHFALAPELIEELQKDKSPHQPNNADGRIAFRFEGEQLIHTYSRTLLPSKFELWLDRILKNKREVRRSVMLQTPFERTRMDAHLQQVNMLLLEQKAVLMQQEKQHQHAILQRRKVAKWEGSQRGIGEAHDQQNVLTPRMSFEQHLTDDMLRQLLEKVFRSADEEHAGRLQHREVAALLFACPLGLTRWEFVQLLAGAQEHAEGWIEYGPFLEKIPKLLDMLRDRREKARQRNVKRRATADAMVLLFREELDETFRMTRELLEGMGNHVASTGLVKRQELYTAMQRTDKYSRQDMAFIMQTIPGNDQGEVEYEALPALLHVLRKESINNAVLEVDPIAIEAELNRTAKEMGVTAVGLVPVWTLREVLDNSGLCLSKMHIHVLLCLSSMNRQGQVVWEEFVAVVQRVLPPLFDSDCLMETADRIGKMVADAEAQAEFEELRGLSVRDSKQKQRASLAARRRSKLRPASHAQLQFMADDGDQGEPPDRESVEKTLVHLFTVLDDRRKGSVPAQVFVGVMHYWSARNGSGSTSGEAGSPLPLNSVSSLSGGAALAAERRYADIVMSCRLTPAEVTGFVAEAKVDPLVQEISYTEHIKAWVATIFEIRRSQFWYSVSHNSLDEGKPLK